MADKPITVKEKLRVILSDKDDMWSESVQDETITELVALIKADRKRLIGKVISKLDIFLIQLPETKESFAGRFIRQDNYEVLKLSLKEL